MNKRFKVFIARPELSRDELISFINISVYDHVNRDVFKITAQRSRESLNDVFSIWYSFTINVDLGLVFEQRKESNARAFIKAFGSILAKLEKMGASNACYLKVIESNFDSNTEGEFLDYRKWVS